MYGFHFGIAAFQFACGKSIYLNALGCRNNRGQS
jgi:hypothetical protein